MMEGQTLIENNFGWEHKKGIRKKIEKNRGCSWMDVHNVYAG